MVKSHLLAGFIISLMTTRNLVLARECSILEVHGSNANVGAGFGISKTGVPRTGTDGDAGADATSFNPGPNPNPICGSVAKLNGPVNIQSELLTATAAGLPMVYNNGSIVMTFFQVNRDGGDPISCEYSADATGNSWQAMDVTFNVPGNFGINPADRQQYTAVATFPPGAKLSGGDTKNVGLIRVRAGPQQQCGGCFAVQMNGQVELATSPTPTVLNQSSPSNFAPLSLTSQQISAIMAKVVTIAKAEGLVAKS